MGNTKIEVEGERIVNEGVTQDILAALRINHAYKTFGKTRALNDVSIEVKAGEVHGLAGANGSGKSTLIKLISGQVMPDLPSPATLYVAGTKIPMPASSRTLWKNGVKTVHQDLGLVEDLTVMENLFLPSWGGMNRLRGRVKWRTAMHVAANVLEESGISAYPDTTVSHLQPRDKVLLAFARVTAPTLAEETEANCVHLLLLDEVTGALAEEDADRMRSCIEDLAKGGVGVLLVSHRLEELQRLCQRVTVMRNGSVVGTWRKEEVREELLIEAMTGTKYTRSATQSRFVNQVSTRQPPNSPVVELRECKAGQLDTVSLAVWPGEVVGCIAGLGSEAFDVARLLSGLSRPRCGSIRFKGVDVTAKWSRHQAARSGVGLVPQDRLREGGIMAASAAFNISALGSPAESMWQVLNQRREYGNAVRLMRNHGVIPVAPLLRLGDFSGGNQQKQIFARASQGPPTLLVLMEPTHGVDVASRDLLYVAIRSLVEANTAVVIASNDEAELARICNRVIVLREGKVIAELNGTEVTEAMIVRKCLE